MRSLLLILALLTLAVVPASAQEVYEVVEEMPEVVGGMKALQEQIVYPESARHDGVQGRVFLQFVVDEEGVVREPVVIRGVDPALDQAALDALTAVRFRPGRHDGQPVKVRLALPITFELAHRDDGGTPR